MSPKLINQNALNSGERITLDDFLNVKNEQIDSKSEINEPVKVNIIEEPASKVKKTKVKSPKKKLFNKMGYKIIKGKGFNI